MVYDSRRYRVHVKVCHHICSYDHRTFLLAEGRHDFCKGVRSAIDIVAVKLNGKFSAMSAPDSQIPASSYLQVHPVRDYMDQGFVFRCKEIEDICRPVG